jgi:hypothetical protein
MKPGERVRLKSGTAVAARSAIPADACGTVICAYQLLTHQPGFRERVDVNFAPHGVLWGQPADAFESPADMQASETN